MAEDPKKTYVKFSGHLPEMWKGSVVNLAMPKRHRRGRRRRHRPDPPSGREKCGSQGKGGRGARVKAAWRSSGSNLPLRAWARQTDEGWAWLKAKT